MRLWLTVFLLSLLMISGLSSKPFGSRQTGQFETNPPSPYFHYQKVGTDHGKVLVVHGLHANKEMMNLLCLGLSDAGFDVYSMDLPGHGDSTIGFNAVLARQAVTSALDVLGPDTRVIGHSLGGAILLDIANDRFFKSMVLLSPAPTPVERIHAERVMVFTGQFDLPLITPFVNQLESTGGMERRVIPWAGHSGYLLQPETIREVVAKLGGDPSTVRTGRRLALLILEILSAVLIPAMWLRGKPVARVQIPIKTTILTFVASCAAAFLICGAIVVMKGLRIFVTDYLISFVLLVGVALLPACRRNISLHFSKLLVGLLAAICVIAVAGYIGSDLIHMSLFSGRWWRFAAIALAVLPLSIADEVLLRPIRPWWKAAGVAALTRILLAAFVVTGVMSLNRNDAFLVLILHFIVLFWIGLWFAGEWLRRNTQDALATAIFTSLVQAWIFAAVFVLT